MNEKMELLKKLWEMEAAEPVRKISSPEETLPSIADYMLKEQEHFLAVTLNGNHEVIKVHVVSVGLVNRAIVHPREIFRPAISDNAIAIILAHNHPSGNLEPSREDRDITDRLKKAGDVLGIEVLDHLIISKRGYYSFLENGDI